MNRFVVVGAGPAGLSLALQLARAGHHVALVEASRQFSRQFRGDALMPCGQEALARMGLSALVAGLPQRPLAGWSVWVNGRKLFAVAEPMGSLQPCRLVPQQLLLEALLEGQAPQAVSAAALDAAIAESFVARDGLRATWAYRSLVARNLVLRFLQDAQPASQPALDTAA